MKGVAPVLAIVLLFGLLYISGAALFKNGIVGSIFPQGSVGGLTILSVSNPSFVDNADRPAGEKWIVHIAQTGRQEIMGKRIVPGDLAQTGETPKQGFSITLNYSEQSCNYDIIPDKFPRLVSQYDIKEFQPGFLRGCTASGAHTTCGQDKWVIYGQYADQRLCYCIQKTDITSAVSVDGIGQPKVRTKSTFQLSTDDGKRVSAEIDSFERSLEVPLGDVAAVTYFGALGGQPSACDSNLEVKDSIYAFKGTATNDPWKVGDKSAYKRYVEASQAVELITGEKYKQDVMNFVATQRQWAAQATNSLGFANPGNPQSTLSGAQIVKPVGGLVNVPLYLLKVSADWVGIKELQPNINIVSVVADQVSVAVQGSLKVNLFNSGDQGTVRVFAQCEQPFKSTVEGGSLTLNNGVSGIIYLPLSVDTGQDVFRKCTVIAHDGVHEYKKDITVHGIPVFKCSVGLKRCRGSTIEICNPQGSGFDPIITCKETEQCIEPAVGQAVCQLKPEPKLCNGFFGGLACILGGVGSFLFNFIVAFMVVTIGLVVLGYVRFRILLSNIRFLLILSAAISLLLTISFNIPMGSILVAANII